MPYFVDWTGYRADFEREASRVLGRPVKVEGTVTVRLIPFPSVSFSDVRVGNPREAPLMTIRTFSMDAEIAPLLSGEVLIYDMRIDHPNAVLTVDKDGAIDWTIRPSTPFDPTQITLEKVTVSDGAVEIRDNAAGREHKVTGLNATMSASTLAGPWRMTGSADFDGRRADVSLSTSEVKPDGTLRLHTRVQPDGLAAVVETDGDVTLTDGRLGYAGTLGIRSDDLVNDGTDAQTGAAGEAQGQGDRQAPLFSKVNVTGRFTADHESIDIPEFRIEQGAADNPYVVNGKAHLDFGAKPGFRITANGQQILLGNEPETKRGPATAKHKPAATFSERLSAFNRLLAAIPIPQIPGTVDLNLPAIIAGGTTVRDVTVKAQPASGGWSISRFTASLPGRTRVEASGKLIAEPELTFNGSLLVASRQPSGLSTWLTGDVDEAVRRLNAAGFSAKVSLSRAAQRFDDLELAIGPTTLKGSFVRRSDGGARPTLLARLHGGALDGDALVALKSFLASDTGAPRLSGNDLDVSLKAGPVTAQGFKAASVDTAFRLSEGRLDIDRLTISDVSGATLTATGRMRPFAASPTGSIDATLLSPDLAKLVSALAGRFPDVTLFSQLRDRAALYPGLFDDTQLSIIGSAARKAGDAIELSLSGNGKTGGTTLSFTGQGKGDIASPSRLNLDLTANAKNPVGETLLALVGLPTLPLDMVGGIESDFALKGTLAGGADTHLSLSGNGTSATVDGRIRLAGGAIAATGKAHVKSEDLDPYLAATGHALPGFGDGLSADLTGAFDLKAGALQLTKVAGTVDGGAVGADLKLSSKDGVPRISGKATLDSLDLTSVAAFLLGPGAFDATGEGWPKTPFSQMSSFPLAADVTVSARQAWLGATTRIDGFSGAFSLQSDDLRLSGIKGGLDGGKLDGLVELRNSGGTALASGQLRLGGADLASLYTTQDGVAPLGGKADISGAINATGKSVAGLMASLAGSGVVSAKGLTIDGLDPNAFRPILAAGDAAGPDAKPARLAAIVAKHFPAGQFKAGDVDLPFTVAAGVARFSGIRVETPAAALTANLRADIGRLRLEGQGDFTFDAGADTEAGAEPTVRFSLDGALDAPRATVDPQPMIQFLTQRALEREQQRVEAMQAVLLEKQRLRRQVHFYEARAEQRKKLEEERKKAEDEAKRKAAEEAAKQKAAEELAKQQAEKAAKLQAEEAAKQQKALEDAQQKAILDALKKEQQTAPAKASGSGAGNPANSNDPVKLQPEDKQTIDQLLKHLKIGN